MSSKIDKPIPKNLAPPRKETKTKESKAPKEPKVPKKKTKTSSSPTRIVYLGWGSLLWDSEGLKVYEWQRTDLKLPLEFSRASDGGFGRLTLVIDTKNGTENRVWAADTEHKNINAAIKAIRKREGSKNPRSIAYVDVKKDTQRVTHTPPHIVTRIEEYAKKHGYDVVIWTDLSSNWVELKYSPFTNENVINYFRFLPMSIQVKVLTYIYQASRVGHIRTKFSEYLFKHIAEIQPPTAAHN